VGQVVGEVLAEWVGDVLGQALDGLGASGNGLDGKANEGNLYATTLQITVGSH